MNQFKDAVLDHIAIAVKNLDQAQKIYEDIGFKFEPKREIVEIQKVETAFAHVDEHAHIELLCPTSDSGAIFDFIKNKGEGIHHMAFLVPNILEKMQELKAKGYRLIYDEPQPGANNKLINFIHPKSSGGVLIEISQERK